MMVNRFVRDLSPSRKLSSVVAGFRSPHCYLESENRSARTRSWHPSCGSSPRDFNWRFGSSGERNAERARSEDAERRGYHMPGCPVTFVTTARPSASLSFSVRHGVTEVLLIGRRKFEIGSSSDARRCDTPAQLWLHVFSTYRGQYVYLKYGSYW